MGKAFAGLMQELGLKDRNDPLCDLVEKKLIELGRQGVRDPVQLAGLAMKSLRD